MNTSQMRWFNQGQPQTLQSAVILMYIDAVFFALLDATNARFVSSFRTFSMVFAIALVIGALGCANEKKIGYKVAVGASFSPFIFRLWLAKDPFAGIGLIGLIFEVLLVVMLLHAQTREYVKIWFK